MVVVPWDLDIELDVDSLWVVFGTGLEGFKSQFFVFSKNVLDLNDVQLILQSKVWAVQG